MSRPTVAHVTTVDSSLRYLLLNQMHSLRAAGYDVVSISSKGPHVAFVEAAGIRHIAVPLTRAVTPLTDLHSLWQLEAVMRRERFTIVHTHTPKAALLGQIAARLARVPIVVHTLHGFHFHEHMAAPARRFYIALEHVAARCSDVVLSQSREDIQAAVREWICPREKITYLGNGIDLSRFDPDRVPDDATRRLRDELSILLVPFADVPSLADAIMQVLASPLRAQHMGDAGRRLALQRFDEGHVFERVRAVYATLLTGKGLSPPPLEGSTALTPGIQRSGRGWPAAT